MCSKKFEGVYLIKNQRNSLLFCYYKLGFRCLELILFSRCFDLKDLNLNKCFEPLRKDLLFTRPNQMSQIYVVYASKSDSSFLRNKHEQCISLHSKPHENFTARRKHGG